MKDAILQRVIDVYNIKANSEAQFAKLIGANQKTINQQFKGDRALSLDTILSIIRSFEDISTEWLLRGTGSMLLSEKERNENTSSIKYDAEVEIGEDGYLKIKIKK